MSSPDHLALLENTPKLAELDLDRYDALMIAGGQSPMFTFPDNADLQAAVLHFFTAQKPTAAYCHGVSALLNVVLPDGEHLVRGRTVTGFANVEEDYGNAAAGVEIMPWLAGGRPARARRELHPGRAVQGVRGPGRAAGHRPAAVLRPGGRPDRPRHARRLSGRP